MKLKAVAVLLIIVLLLPLYMLYKYLEQKMRPRESFGNFFLWMITMLVLIFISTFCIVFIIRLLFPVA